MILLHIREFQMLMMLLQNSPSLLEQLGGGATLIQKELERREKVEKMNVRQIFSLSPGLFPRAQDGSQHMSHEGFCYCFFVVTVQSFKTDTTILQYFAHLHNTPCFPPNIFHLSIVFSYSWGDCNTQEKWLCKICRREVGGQTRYNGRYANSELSRHVFKTHLAH